MPGLGPELPGLFDGLGSRLLTACAAADQAGDHQDAGVSDAIETRMSAAVVSSEKRLTGDRWDRLTKTSHHEAFGPGSRMTATLVD